jgi:hypothetical protein
MTDRLPAAGRRPWLDLEPLSLGRRAAFRRVLAVLKAQPSPFVVAGAVGLSLHLGQLIDGELEVYLRPDDIEAALESLRAAGLKIDRDDAHAKARVTYGEHRVILAWSLPYPLGGPIDDGWFENARRTHILGVRVRLAPLEELLWLRLAIPGGASLGDPMISQLLLERGTDLDWGRFLERLAGVEALLLSHLFLFWHQYPESARHIIPTWVMDNLLNQVNAGASSSIH